MPSMRDAILTDPVKLAREIASDVMASEEEISAAIRLAILYEREACARIADAAATYVHNDDRERAVADGIAQDIRDRT